MKYFLKNSLLSLFIFFSFNSFSQDYDESFLESLPEEIKKDLIDRSLQRDELEKPTYRSSYINKPNQDEGISRFGDEYFSLMQTTLMPLNEPNLDGRYILDFGDVLQIQYVGQKSDIYKFMIQRDGSVNIPDIGKIYFSGLSLDKANDFLKGKVEESFIGVDAYMTLVNVRDIQIIVSGNAYNPGSFTLNGNSNVFHALTIAGGPSETGSFRSIDLIREGEIIDSVDLYDTFIFGKPSFGKRLRSGDIIHINPSLNQVSVIGGVKRPNTYELKEDESLEIAITFANNLNSFADLSKIRVFRVKQGEIEAIQIDNLTQLDSMISKDFDSIVVGEYKYKKVSIEGAVENPGDYLLKEGDGITNAIKRAGGYSKEAYVFGSILENSATREINKDARESLYMSFLAALSSASAGPNLESADQAVMINLMQELRNSPPSGRVVTEFNLEKLAEFPDQEWIIQDGDKIIIPEYINQVYVFGEVSSEGSAVYEKSLDIFDYIERKGGATQRANLKNIYVTQPNGETFRIEKNIFIGKKSIEIYPGSIIFVPTKVENRFFAAQTAQAYASILGNIGVALASVSVLKD